MLCGGTGKDIGQGMLEAVLLYINALGGQWCRGKVMWCVRQLGMRQFPYFTLLKFVGKVGFGDSTWWSL